MISRIYVAAAVALVGLIAPGVTAASAHPSSDGAAAYKYITVAVPGEKNTAVADINDFGSYVGEGCNASCTKRRQFIASPQGKLTFLPAIPFANFSPSASYLPVGIDDSGDVDGQYTDSQGATHGYLLSADGAWTEIDDPMAADINGGGTVPESISADGSVIPGTYYDSNLVPHGFLYHDGTFRTCDVPGASGTVINFYYDGEFGGDYFSSNGAEWPFYVTKDGSLQLPALGLPNPSSAGEGAMLTAVSADGTLFGFEVSQEPIFGFAYANGKSTTITDPDEVATTSLDGTEAANANLEGVVVGDYTYTPGTPTQAGYLHGYIAIPLPEGGGGSQ